MTRGRRRAPLMPDVIQKYAIRSAQATPDAPYVTAEGKTRTYAWLDTRSSQLANLLLGSKLLAHMLASVSPAAARTAS